MTEQDWIVVVALLVLSVAVAYSLGARRASTRSKPVAEPTEKAGVATRQPTVSAALLTSAAPEVAAPSVEVGVAKLGYEEDEEIDPTKIGAVVGAKRPVYQAPVHRIVYDEDAAIDEPTRAESLFLVSATAQTDTGLRRARNEDSLLVLEAEQLFVVADGMGGYRGGELASQLAVKTIASAFQSRTFDGPAHDGIAAQASDLARAIQMANAAILDLAGEKRELEGMGTTLCAARFSANKKRVYIGHVGDSRCYRLRDGLFAQLTADHTMAVHGVKGPQAAHLSRAVGIWPTVPIDIVIAVPLAGDVYVLCSDGLTKMLADEDIATVLRAGEDLKLSVERLIELANSRGGKDNVTVVLVRVVPPN